MAVEIVAFTWDCRIAGAIPLADDRLTDMLNAVTRIVMRDASVEDLDSGQLSAGDIQVDSGHLVAVVATGRPGLTSRRRKTRVQRIRVDLGRYAVAGLLHRPVTDPDGPISGRPELVLAGRDVLVPLTCASISYESRGRAIVEDHETILINRAHAAWIDALGEEEAAGPPPRWSGRARYLKDLTGIPTS